MSPILNTPEAVFGAHMYVSVFGKYCAEGNPYSDLRMYIYHDHLGSVPDDVVYRGISSDIFKDSCDVVSCGVGSDHGRGNCKHI